MVRSDAPLRLLDVNVLIALSLPNHVHHGLVSRWFDGVARWATCSITQSAYIRLLLNPKVTGFPVAAGRAREGLAQLCRVEGHEFLADDAPLAEPLIDMTGLVGFRQVTDLHLVDLAARHGAVLSTIDGRIPDALVAGDRRHIELIEV